MGETQEPDGQCSIMSLSSNVLSGWGFAACAVVLVGGFVGVTRGAISRASLAENGVRRSGRIESMYALSGQPGGDYGIRVAYRENGIDQSVDLAVPAAGIIGRSVGALYPIVVDPTMVGNASGKTVTAAQAQRFGIGWGLVLFAGSAAFVLSLRRRLISVRPKLVREPEIVGRFIVAADGRMSLR